MAARRRWREPPAGCLGGASEKAQKKVALTPHQIVVLAVAIEIALLGIAAVVEFSCRKKRPPSASQPAGPAPGRPDIAQTAAGRGGPLSAGTPSATDAQPEKLPLGAAGTAPTSPAPETRARAEAQPPARAASSAAPNGTQPAPAGGPIRATADSAPTADAGSLRARRIFHGVGKTRARLLAVITGVLGRPGAPLAETCEQLEEALIAADVGVAAAAKLVGQVKQRLAPGATPEQVRQALKEAMVRILQATARPPADPGEAPLVVLVAGVNGVGKTTSVAKLAAKFKAERGPVVVAAADTFRAAAIDQLAVWCRRAEVELIRQQQGADPAAVAFDAVQAARSRGAKTVIIDTAGRLHTRTNLMEELKKIARVVGREIAGAPHERWLVVDATTGQNAISQAAVFTGALELSGVILAKLDSSARGGVIIAIADQLGLPVRFVGLGEGLEDLQEFDPAEFCEALLAEERAQGEQVEALRPAAA